MTLNILVVEDTEKHRESARKQFGSGKFMLAGNYEQALGVLRPKDNQFDVVLTDLLMIKGGPQTMGNEGMKYIFDELPYGFPIAFLAAKLGVPYIAIVTDVNHHNHPMSAAIDPIGSSTYSVDESGLYKINKSILGIFHAPLDGNGRKDWKKVLETLRK